MIRPATVADVPRLVEMGAAFLASSPYAGRLADNPAQMTALATRLITDDDGAVFVVDRDGDLVGMIGVLAARHFLSDECVAYEVFWWVEPSSRGCGIRLMQAAERWAKAAGAVRLAMIAPSDEVGQLYERLGYDLVERSYERIL